MSNLELLEDACARLPHTTRRMFGGAGLFAPNGGMFAGLVDDDRIMLKFVIGTPDHEEFCELGAAPWEYAGGAKPMTMKEWLVIPEAFYDEPRQLAAWAARAHKAVPPKKARPTKRPSETRAAGKKKPATKKAATTKKPATKRPASKPKNVTRQGTKRRPGHAP